MTTVAAPPLSASWKDRLGLATRRSPELYEAGGAVTDVPHAAAIRTALDEIGLSALLCVQGVPTVAILVRASYDRGAVMHVHASLWNQGLATLLLVIAGDTVRAFSLARTPLDGEDGFEARCLVQTLDATSEALKCLNLVYGAESGRLWHDHESYFQPSERIDQVLLSNLKAAHGMLQQESLSSDAAQALLIQAMFIAYLEDRGIVTPAYFEAVSGAKVKSFSAILEGGEVPLLRALFRVLRRDFNGDLFVAPCSFEAQKKAPELNHQHLGVLARFRSGHEEMGKGGQRRLWGYDFRYIPIELVSAVYDRFLGEQEEERRELGAYYTPMFLADTVASQAWEMLPASAKGGRFLDPACGSGVFLVRSFQRLCEHWRATHSTRTIPWKTLVSLLDQVHGWDVNGGAVRVAVFSLYVALLEEVSPPNIRKLVDRGKLLPDLWEKTIRCRDFFEVPPEKRGFEVILGNPPWTSRRGINRSSVRWCEAAGFPMPGREDAWAFVWKALAHVAPGGLIAFLLPAMGFLHNHAKSTVEARVTFFKKSRVRRVINFADLRFQLFEKAHRPAALIVFAPLDEGDFPYRFDYWTPKADLNLRLKRVITLSATDKGSLSVASVVKHELIFKQRLWMREPEAKLFSHLWSLPKLRDFVKEFGSGDRANEAATELWVIGQGYQPFTGDLDTGGDDQSRPLKSKIVGRLPDLPIAAFTRLAQSARGLKPARSPWVRRRGFEAGFKGVRVLIPKGIGTAQNRLRASYCDSDLTFQDALQAITIPDGHEFQAKLITAFMNSRIAVWCAFHGTGSFGSDRPIVHQSDLLCLPFPSLSDVPDRKQAAKAADQLVQLIDLALTQADTPLQADPQDLLSKIDRWTYAYFGLSSDEIALIDDTVEFILPALQPHEGNYPNLWRSPSREQRSLYAETLAASLSEWFRERDTSIGTRLVALGLDLAILRLCVGENEPYSEDSNGELVGVLRTLAKHIHQPLDGNFQLMPDMRVFVGDSLYLVKPMQQRFWLRSTALADADAIALDLEQATVPRKGSAI